MIEPLDPPFPHMSKGNNSSYLTGVRVERKEGENAHVIVLDKCLIMPTINGYFFLKKSSV